MKQAAKRLLLPRPGPRRIPVGIAKGLYMQIDFTHETRLFLGLYEVELNRHLRRMLHFGVQAFDIGAQAGYDSLVIAKHTGAPVVAFECEPSCLDRMAASFALNPSLAPLVTPVEAMVGVDVGLDDYARESGVAPGFIKLDVEGGELNVLESASQLLANRRPSMIVEVHSASLERGCGELLADHGYQVTIVNQRRIAPDYRPTHELNRWLVAEPQTLK